jgi:hypothetical protein
VQLVPGLADFDVELGDAVECQLFRPDGVVYKLVPDVEGLVTENSSIWRPGCK